MLANYIASTFCTMAGIICMCDAEGNGLESLMGVFRLPNADIRVRRLYFSLPHRIPYIVSF